MADVAFPNIQLYKGWGKPLRTESTVPASSWTRGMCRRG